MMVYQKELTVHHLFGLFVFACACTVKLSRLKSKSFGPLGLGRKDSSMNLSRIKRSSGFSLLGRKDSDDDSQEGNEEEMQPLVLGPKFTPLETSKLHTPMVPADGRNAMSE